MATTDEVASDRAHASAKIQNDDHATFKADAERFDSNIMEIIGASRRVWEEASDRRKIAAIRQVRESGIKVA